MSIALFFIMITLIKPETDKIEGGKDVIKQQLAELGPLKGAEIRLIIISVALLFFWSTEGLVHPLDTTTVTIIAIAILLAPKVGVYTWNEVEKLIPWGTVIVFAVGIALVTAFNILIHLGFASATSLASALIPVFIALATTITLDVDQISFVLLQQFVISFGFLLPISAPQNMLAYGTGAFTTRDFLKSGIPLTIIGYLLVLLFSATYWKWIGLL